MKRNKINTIIILPEYQETTDVEIVRWNTRTYRNVTPASLDRIRRVAGREATSHYRNNKGYQFNTWTY